MLRMEPAMFHELEARLTPRLLKRDSNFKGFTPGLKLAITLKYLATGFNFKTLMQGVWVSSNNISLIVREVCGSIVEEYRDEVINCPKTEEEWKEVAGNFATRWSFCHALGALDRKHVRIQKPPKWYATTYGGMMMVCNNSKFILSTNGYVYLYLLLYTVLHKHSYLITTLIYCCQYCSQSPAYCLYLCSLC